MNKERKKYFNFFTTFHFPPFIKVEPNHIIANFSTFHFPPFIKVDPNFYNLLIVMSI